MIVVERAITLTQPWASLMALGAKLIETRGRPTKYRGWIAIHAAKNFPTECQALICEEYFGPMLHMGDYHSPADLPLGAIVAVTRVVDCCRTEELVRRVDELERTFGNYSPGRYGYVTEGVRPLRQLISMSGNQAIPWRLPRPITEQDLLP